MSFVGIGKKTTALTGKAALVMSVTLVLSGCQDGQSLNLFKKKAPEEGAAVATARSGGKVVERDVEMPDVFQTTEA